MSRRQNGGSKSANPEQQLRQEAAIFLSPDVEHELAQILQRRESIERALQRMDVEVYDLETAFLKHCVSHGGSLFDGFGLERRDNAHRNPVAVLTPVATCASSIGGGGSAIAPLSFEATPGSSPSSLLLPTVANGEHARTYRVLSSFFGAGGASGGSNGSAATDLAVASHSPTSLKAAGSVASPSAAATVFQVGSKGSTAPAFHYRIHFFSPSERVFSACSVGALSRVEIAKSTLAGSRGEPTSSTWSTTAAAAGRGKGLGKRGRFSSGGDELRGGRSGTASLLSELDRRSNAPPSRRHQRYAKEEDDADDDDASENGSGDRRRRRRQTE
ncbi:Histone acetyltransferase subunit NuA4, putative [Leishmania donovani]|uniref:Histone acetyltransferase subunit NuA4, putative n=1 Tax=Leishmania donovani TaxID=5661 RepID=A0A3S7WZY7_LEIDO|nr:Histone acetyltransferase subunit NuA4, putative [Leishmania donovani]